MNLSSDHLLTIRKLIDEGPISRPEMRENLIDHICCAVEDRMESGSSFKKALSISLEEIAPNGFKEIEFETYLMFYSKQINMKKFTYSTGLLFSICASLSIVFKILHLTGANELLLIGFGGLAIVFIPLLMLVRHDTGKSTMEKSRERLFMVSIMLISIGAILKLFHLAGSNETLLIGISVFSLGFLPLMFLKMYRESVTV